MKQADGKFRHQSVQDRKSIKALLEAVTKGVGKGELTFSDDDGSFTLEPDGLMTVRIRGEKSDGACRFDISVTWSERPDEDDKSKPVKIS
ncbi:amphi-Trp domain-containing protein [Chachezhania antarctica]|uniref:amphi-Trp domain-containing protein n=1 Tax=Chachezhania antarctica TaxID=2340860 RepID=UPI000EB56658|nr:amphi-Trp domain-containing protein [Chachezhania antarctica]